jgi:hypothetical protein
VVPETHDPVPHAFQMNRSFGVVGYLLSVLSTIGFDNQSGFQSCKIHNIGFNHYLAPKFVAH